MLLFVATEAALFAVFVASFFYLRFENAGPWPPDGIAAPDFLMPSVALALMLGSGVTMALAARSSRGGRAPIAWLAATAALGIAFVIVQSLDVDGSLDEFGPRTTAYGSAVYTLDGLHLAHAVLGLLLLAWAACRWRNGRHSVSAVSLYWEFVVAVAVVLYLSLTVTPHL
jgi:heme/copper-type cytochrome/quinol oxidase subunit 3